MESNIYYMELVDEQPHSADTMKHVSELLLSTFTGHQNGYMILVGDGKTYEHLMEIKQLYGSSLQKLLIFPGDWHTLKNFQPVLMKIYYPVGLKELAKASGFRGETLKSLKSPKDAQISNEPTGSCYRHGSPSLGECSIRSWSKTMTCHQQQLISMLIHQPPWAA